MYGQTYERVEIGSMRLDWRVTRALRPGDGRATRSEGVQRENATQAY
jgi:hypothetical protein